MRLLPDRFHYVLGEILGRRRCKTKPHQLRLHAWPEMVEQNCECPAVARRADGREQIVKLVLPCGRAAGGKVIINVSAAGQIHDIPPARPKNF